MPVPAVTLPLAAPDLEVTDPGGWLDWLVGAPLQSLVALLIGGLALVVARWSIARTVRSVVEGGTTVRRHARRLLLRTKMGQTVVDTSPLAAARRVQRAETMGSVLRSAAALVVGILVLTAIANINDWNLGPVLASAGVVGVALGFGAQTLVKDFLSGVFMLIEDQYGVGDVVDLGVASGSVEAVGLRVTQVRDLQGTLWFVRNGEVLRVGNKTQGWSRAVVEVRVGPDEDVPAVAEMMRAAASGLTSDDDLSALLLGDPEVTTFEDLTGDSVMLRAAVKTAPSKQWEVQRALRALISSELASHGVAQAVPRREVLVERDAGARQGQQGQQPTA
ncbi:MAG: mechanosensitive ion channel [Cellulomonadaceae bacterium]|nr:mechanosensitive ion channel [Cellulomonadaceae bacterium]